MLGGTLTVEDIAEPVPGPGEVLVEVLRAGICGSDKGCADHGQLFNDASQALLGADLFDLQERIVFGHEFVASVVAYGPDTSGAIPIGTRVVAMPLRLREPQVMLGFAGVQLPGAYAQKMVLSEALLLPVPDELPTEVAALTEPLAVAQRAVNRIDTTTRDVPFVQGCGPIGLAIIAVLKARGVGPIVASDLSAERREIARTLGADIVVDPRQESPYAAWSAAAVTDDPAEMGPPTALIGQLPLRPTVGFECTGVPGLLDQLMSGSPPASRLSVAGIALGEEAIHPGYGILKELDVSFSLYYSAAEFAQTLELLASGALDAGVLITDTVGLDDVATAFERLTNSPADAKILIDPSL